jgi:hypothetical protein
MIGLGLAAIQGFMMHVCSRRFTGTQFALLSSLAAVPRVILVAQAGVVAQYVGWPGFFLFSVTLAIPGLLLLTRYDFWMKSSDAKAKTQVPSWDRAIIAFFLVGLIAISIDSVAKWGAAAVGIALLLGFLKPKHA